MNDRLIVTALRIGDWCARMVEERSPALGPVIHHESHGTYRTHYLVKRSKKEMLARHLIIIPAALAGLGLLSLHMVMWSAKYLGEKVRNAKEVSTELRAGPGSEHPEGRSLYP